MTKTVGFVLLDQFSDWQLGYLPAALSMLGNGQYETRILAQDAAKPVTSLGSVHVMPDAGLDTCKNADGLVLIGAMAWKTQTSEQVAPIVGEFAKTGKPLGAISDAISVLATLGILNDKAHTANDKAELAAWAQDAYKGEKLFQEKPAVRDGNLVTANGSAVLEFTREMLVVLGVAEVRAAEWYAFNKGGMGNAR